MMKKLFWAVGLLAVAGIAHAGTKTSQQVVVSTSGLYAFGNLGAARNSADSQQRIGCEVFAEAGWAEAIFFANDSTGHYLSCSSTDPFVIAAVQASAGDSDLYFSSNSSGVCTLVEITNSSTWEPK